MKMVQLAPAFRAIIHVVHAIIPYHALHAKAIES
jgi:hypothetical protein